MKSLIAIFIMVIALGGIAYITMQPKNTNNQTQEPLSGHYSAILHTEAGDMTVELNATATPKTVSNFVTLAKKGFYNNTIFHRVIKGFMIQGGDPKGDGTGGPGYTIPDESFEGEYTRGTIAMARTNQPNSAGSQFFIIHQDSLQLPKDYVIFGKLTAGLDVLDKIATAPTKMNAQGTEQSVPETPVKITNIEIVEK